MGLPIERRGRRGLVAVTAALAVLVAGCNLGKPPANYTVATTLAGPGMLAQGDLDGDGSTDLLVGSDHAYTVLLNDGAGGFATAETTTTPLVVRSVRLVDVDGDGHLDMLSYDSVTTVPGLHYLWRGDGLGGFGEPTSLGSERITTVGDLNGDGHPDLVTPPDSSAIVVVRLGDGAGGFGDRIESPTTPLGFAGGEVADFTGDDLPDVMVIGVEIVCSDPSHCSFTPKTVLLTGDGTGALSASPARPAGNRDLAVGDFDEDGAVDAVTAAGPIASATSLSLLRSDGAGGLAPAVPVPVGKPTCELDAGDFDSDGHLDLVLATEGNTGTVLFGDGTGQFPASHAIATAGGPNAISPCNSVLSGPLDGDARPDVAFLSEPIDTLTVLLNRWTHRPS